MPAAPEPVLLTPAEHVQRLAAAMERFTAALAEADLAAPVPGCPGWDVADLGSHLGGVHRWARGAIVEGHPGVDPGDGPRERDALVAWYREGADDLLDTLNTADPADPCWSFGPKPSRVAFWCRRQDHETWMHLWDARSAKAGAAAGAAADADPTAGSALIEPVLAADGLDETAAMFFPRQVRLRRIGPLARSLALEPTDAAGRWVLAGDGTGPAGAPDAAAEATVRGPAEALLLLLWKRAAPTDPRIAAAGDPDALGSVLAEAITP